MKTSLLLFLCTLFLILVDSRFSNTTSISASSLVDTATSAVEESELNVVDSWKTTEKRLKDVVSNLVKSMLPSILEASESLNISSKCSRSMLKLLIGLTQLKAFAFRMFDASGKFPNGIFSGSINSLGDYDVCINTVVPKNFVGQYCLLDFKPPLPPRQRFVNYDHLLPEFVNATSQDSALSVFMANGRYHYHINFRTSICVPSTCSRKEIENIVQKALFMMEMKVEAMVPNCEIKTDKRKLDNTEISIFIVLCITVSIAFAATIADVTLNNFSVCSNHENRSLALRCLLCFSLYTNFMKLMKKDDSPDSIKIFHGMKFFTMLWIILCHTYYYQNHQAMSHLMKVREIGREFLSQFLCNGIIAVETFFFISAVLVSYGINKLKGKKFNVLLFVFRRFWRLTPPLMFIIGITILLPHLGSGPVWKETIADGLTEKCRKNWWANLLYFTNFLLSSEMCLNWTWYIPVDFHLYILSLIVLIPIKRNPRIGLIMNAVLFVSGFLITAIFHVYYNLAPLGVFVFMHPKDIEHYENRGYHRTYVHISTYSIGLFVGYFLATNRKLKIPLIVNLIGWVIAFIMGLGVTFGIYNWNQGHLPNMFISVLFGSTDKAIFALGLAYITISCMTGNGGIATRILSWNGFVPLGRLTYMVYLVHSLIHFTYVGSTRILIAMEHRTLIHQYLGTVVKSYLAALLASLLFETPFLSLEKNFLSSAIFKDNRRKESLRIEEDKKNPKLDAFVSKNECFLNQDDGVFCVNIKNIVQES